MLLFPAIDLKEGKAVRLLQGRMEDSTVYADDPVEVAENFKKQGASHLHVVDLNGAFTGQPVNDEVIRKIVGSVSLKVQVGGGIRTMERITELLELGVERVILGTIAVKDPQLVAEAARRYGERIIVGIDALGGRVAVQGWAEATEMQAVDLAQAMKNVGVKHIVFTDIARDGMLSGPNIESTVQLAQETGINVITSGGISTLEDIRRLQTEHLKGIPIEGAITGKALYSGAFTLKEALEAANYKPQLTEKRGE
ncbi:1-(5-phosphoribosyl)-5-((5-phosphoribosylamino)methylideneamino) imidazole-4-carboxamide isomerase [Desulfosporosinus acidiphilus SJ4]|uniref:1-(5-phosphoribosyl)-5-[(5-phosphoribosylamino)methylideneamino] imidazole-4-carboxamide isomerase n=1 Tax=Desulfosporosinus acidiphilus (strain DSM 22704 / JCM 16185 / SJ4) TaxID=646529 RepID=I4D2F5_DESAJ|nr:1-(5-phosphoribosyl)-5-[(5-phosphoribosylamino)methylideneamino]imidazole-4-carboxamide isomerase [Desulfosporosinus acidiphilus]AFM39979.1 1-(5-phosphoribosyl)-5-((5-phosphoribosylamino)methylideneamino) imidazole-4-carboxamide isomerase [Desulfosporosinus acidiphilus SJ4]